MSTDPTRGEAAWHPLRIELRRVSCPTATFCVGIDPGSGTSPGPQYIVTTTDPAGGPSAWQEFAIPHAKGQFWAGISCGSASLCLAYESGRFNKGYFAKTGGHLMVSTDPGAGGAAWRITSLHDVVEAADCIGHFCILGTSDGAVLTSNDPTSGHWRKVNITGANRGQLSSLGLVACTTSSYCLVGAEGTNAVWYAHKPSSARHWRQLSAIASLPGYPSIFAAGCASSGRCVLAIDELTRASNVAEMISSPAPGGKWRGARVKGQYFGASCPSETMCVAAGSKTYNDSPAQVIAGQSAP